MPDHKSKAEKLAEGKKKLKKFQSKNKHKADPENASTKTDGGTPPVDVDNIVPALAPPQPATTAELFAAPEPGQASSVFDSIANSNPASTVSNDSSVPSTAYAIPSNVDRGQSHSLDNFRKLSKQFESLEAEIGTPNHLAVIEDLKSLNADLLKKHKEDGESIQALNIRLRDQYSNVDALKLEIQRLQLDGVTRINAELGALRSELDNHIRTIAVLVSEKAELKATLNSVESQFRSREHENEEVQAKLKANRHLVQQLRDELAATKSLLEKANGSPPDQKVQHENETLSHAIKSAQARIDELNRQSEIKDIEINKLRSDLREKSDLVESLQLRVVQLSSDDEDAMMRDRIAEANAQQKILLDGQIQELLKQVEKANSDRDSTANHYQNYTQALSKERDNLVTTIQDLKKERDELMRRDADLVKHIGELERQMQQQKTVQAKVQQQEAPPPTPQDPASEERQLKLENDCEVLQEKLREEKENVQKISETLEVRETQIQELEAQVARMSMNYVDPGRITAQLESDKVAAGRAMSQNQELGQQLEEMRSAFVMMSNDKARLMTDLESEQYLGRELMQRHKEMEAELKLVKEQFRFKDEEMIRLTHENTEQQKSILVQRQELDQLRRLEMNQRNHSHLQQEIQKQRDQIHKLQAMIEQKECEVQVLDEIESPPVGNDTQMNCTLEVSVAEEVGEELKANAEDTLLDPADVEVQVLPPEQAMLKLQERFTKTMDEIAELTEQKQRLEHLVIQLQGETETIGEYIALYQSQRKLLKQREIEKDIQVQKIERDREEMKDKLTKLNSLVEVMLTQRQSGPDTNAVSNGGHQTEASGHEPATAPAASTKETAEQILDLLTEIKTSNMNLTIGSHDMTATCSCCSGQLLTV